MDVDARNRSQENLTVNKSLMLMNPTWGIAKPRAQMTRSEVHLKESVVEAGGNVMCCKGKTGIQAAGGFWRMERISLVGKASQGHSEQRKPPKEWWEEKERRCAWGGWDPWTDQRRRKVLL